MLHDIRYARQARDDLQSLIHWIADQAGLDVALDYAGRIEQYCARLADFPRRGRLRRRTPQIRSLPFRRNATILYRVTRREVLILRVLHNGRDINAVVGGSG